MIRDRYERTVPTTVDELKTLPGVGPKTAILVMNEAYGLYAGIGTDKHVCYGADALGLFGLTFGLTRAKPDHVETSLCTWISRDRAKDINKTFGSFAQLLTQQLATIWKDNVGQLKVVLQAIYTRFSSPYELELKWFLIGRLRAYYQAKRRRMTRRKKWESKIMIVTAMTTLQIVMTQAQTCMKMQGNTLKIE